MVMQRKRLVMVSICLRRERSPKKPWATGLLAEPTHRRPAGALASGGTGFEGNLVSSAASRPGLVWIGVGVLSVSVYWAVCFQENKGVTYTGSGTNNALFKLQNHKHVIL